MAIKKFISGLFVFSFVIFIAALGSMYIHMTGDRDGRDGNALIAKNKILPPYQVSDLDISKVYNGSEITLDIDESPYYTIEGNKATEVGTYNAKITLIDGKNFMWMYDEYKESDTIILPWTIEKAKVPIPQAFTTLTFNGQLQCGVTESSAYSLSGHTATNAGRYAAIATLKDTKNYCWQMPYSQEDTSPKSIAWEIKKQVVEIDVDSRELPYNGKSQSITIEKSDLYSIEDTSAIDPAEYFTILTLNDWQNYRWANSDVAENKIAWSIVANKNTKENAITLPIGASTGELAVKGDGMWYQFVLKEPTTIGFNISNHSGQATVELYRGYIHKTTIYNYVRIINLDVGTYYCNVKSDSSAIRKAELSIYNVNAASSLLLNTSTESNLEKTGGKWYKLNIQNDVAVKLVSQTNDNGFNATLYNASDLDSLMFYNSAATYSRNTSGVLTSGDYYLVIYSSTASYKDASLIVRTMELHVGDTNLKSTVDRDGDWYKLVLNEKTKIKFLFGNNTTNFKLQIYNERLTLGPRYSVVETISIILDVGTYYVNILNSSYSQTSEVEISLLQEPLT